jgi:hypothetical protein
MLDYSKEAWVNGKKGMYVLPDTTIQTFDIDSMKYMESEFGIFVSDSGRDQDKLEQARAIGQSMVQAGIPTSAVLDMFDTENFIGLKDKIKKAEKAQQELQQAQQEAQKQQQEQQMQMQQQQMQMQEMSKDKDRQVEIEKALIAAESRDQSAKIDFDMQKMIREFELKEEELKLKEKALYKEGDTIPNGE